MGAASLQKLGEALLRQMTSRDTKCQLYVRRVRWKSRKQLCSLVVLTELIGSAHIVVVWLLQMNCT